MPTQADAGRIYQYNKHTLTNDVTKHWHRPKPKLAVNSFPN